MEEQNNIRSLLTTGRPKSGMLKDEVSAFSEALTDLHEQKAMCDIVILWPDTSPVADPEAIEQLVKEWRHRARRLFWDAPHDDSTITATRAMRQAAVLYTNCVDELIQALGLSKALLPSDKREGIAQ